MCLDRTLPVSLFEKDKSQRSAVTINITGIGAEPVIVENTEQPEEQEQQPQEDQQAPEEEQPVQRESAKVKQLKTGTWPN